MPASTKRIGEIMDRNIMESTIEVKLQICQILFEQTEDILILCNMQGWPVKYNRAAKELLELPPGKSALQSVLADFCDLSANTAPCALEDALNSPERDIVFTYLKTVQGLMSVSVRKWDITAADGSAGYNLLQIRKRAEDSSLAQGDSLLQQVLEDAQDAVISKDLSGKITSWNKGAERMFGYKKKEVIGRHISVIIPEDRLHEESSILQKIRRGLTVRPYDTIREKKSGKKLDVTLTVSPVRNENGQIIGVSKIARDISKKKKAENTLNTLQTNRDELIAVASHEIKTPLAVLKGYLELIYQNVSHVNKTFVEKALTQVKRLTTLINSLFQVSKLNSKKDPISFETLNISALAADLMEQFQVASPTRDFKYFIQENIHIEGNKTKLEQVISNLISNAVKYSPGDRPIEISLKQIGDKVRFTVKDEGIGIATRDQKHIFSQYYRAGNIESSTPGLGLGLYISKTIILQHHGKINVESKKGTGTIFTVVLPLVQRKKKG